MTTAWKRLLAGCALACFTASTPALSQSLSGAGDQQGQGDPGDPTAANAATAQMAIPTISTTPFQPMVIPSSPAQPSAPSTDASTDDEPKQAVTARKPPPASEFEQYVSTIVGEPLRRFGSDLLVPGARGFTAPPTTTIPPDYRLNPGDTLLIGITGSVQASDLRLTIDSEGRIFVPRIGAVHVGGVRYGDVRDVISQAVSGQYRNFSVDVSVAQLHGITVYVTGFAMRPGSYTVSSLSTLVNAVLAAGGPASGGSFRSIELRRDGQQVTDFDLYDLLLNGNRSGDAVVQSGDVIYIAPAGPQVAVTGSVNHQAIYELAPGETIADALKDAGGINTVADATRVMLLASLGQTDNGWKQLTLAQAGQQAAGRGDIVRVLSNAGIARPLEQQPVLVTISGEVAHPGRYYVLPGTRLADAMAQAGGLTADAFPFAAVITRESVKAQQRESFDRAVADMQLSLTAQPVTSADRAQLVQPANIALVKQVVAQLRQRQPTGRMVFDLAPDARQLPGGLVLENNDTIYVPPRPVTVGVFGAVPSPGSLAFHQGEDIEDYVRAAGGVQKLGDKGEIFVVRANGSVLAKGGHALHQRALPGDLIYVPLDADRGEFWARLRNITGSLFGGLVGAASIKSLAD
jgi:protein involved in polysaccharide export with SLBB domain